MTQVTFSRTTSRFGPLQISIVVLAVVTGLVHLYRAVSMSLFIPSRPPAGHGFGPHPGGPGGAGGPAPSIGFSLLSHLPVSLTTLFYLNFVGYIVLAIALYFPQLRQYQHITRWVLIIYTAITIIAWFLITGGSPNILAYIDKPIELALIVLLIIEDQRARSFARG